MLINNQNKIKDLSKNVLMTGNTMIISKHLNNLSNTQQITKLPIIQSYTKKIVESNIASLKEMERNVDLGENIYIMKDLKDKLDKFLKKIRKSYKELNQSMKENDLQKLKIEYENFKYKLHTLSITNEQFEANNINKCLTECKELLNVIQSYKIPRELLHVNNKITLQIDSILDNQKHSIKNFQELLEKSYAYVKNNPLAVKPFRNHESIKFNEIEFYLNNTKRYDLVEKVRKQKEERIEMNLKAMKNYNNMNNIFNQNANDMSDHIKKLDKRTLRQYITVCVIIAKFKFNWIRETQSNTIKSLEYIGKNYTRIFQSIHDWIYKNAVLSAQSSHYSSQRVLLKSFDISDALTEKNKELFYKLNTHVLFYFNCIVKNLDSMPLGMLRYFKSITKNNNLTVVGLFTKFELKRLFNSKFDYYLKTNKEKRRLIISIQLILRVLVNNFLLNKFHLDYLEEEMIHLIASIMYYSIIDYFRDNRMEDLDEKELLLKEDFKNRIELKKLTNAEKYTHNAKNPKYSNLECEYSRVALNHHFKESKIIKSNENFIKEFEKEYQIITEFEDIDKNDNSLEFMESKLIDRNKLKIYFILQKALKSKLIINIMKEVDKIIDYIKNYKFDKKDK